MMMNKVILESLEEAKAKNIIVETQNHIERRRKVGNPVGLKNI